MPYRLSASGWEQWLPVFVHTNTYQSIPPTYGQDDKIIKNPRPRTFNIAENVTHIVFWDLYHPRGPGLAATPIRSLGRMYFRWPS
jgi:hypothetical protein